MMIEEFCDLGIACIPLHPIVDGRCGCGRPDCKAVGKHPVHRDWPQATPLTLDEIDEAREAGHFKTGYGVLVSAGLVVIDVDARNGGVESLERLLERVPDLIIRSGLVVATGSGGGSVHIYYRTSADTAQLVQSLPDYPGIDVKTSGYVVGPGSLHASGDRYTVLEDGSPYNLGEAPDELIALLKKTERYRADFEGRGIHVDLDDVRAMLARLDPSCGREEWIRAGMAIHHATGGHADGFNAWDRWSAKAGEPTYPGTRALWRQWTSFKHDRTDPITVGTLIAMSGWTPPVTFDASEVEWDELTPEEAPGVDLLRPPGFVGHLVDWINAQSYYPRKNLAVAAALTVVSSVAGMRHRDEDGRTTPNVFMFCVAASATGKQSILDSTNRLLAAAGLAGATYGNFKSEQEIYRNLFEHQAAIYVVDELGEVLAKVVRAKGPGGPSYLSGIIGQLMSIYSAADGTLNVTGDAKRKLGQERAAAYRALVDEYGERPDDPHEVAMVARAKEQLASVEQGLSRPFLNVFGITTPETFDDVLGYDAMVNGFVGRTIIVRELDDNPRRNKSAKPTDIPVTMAIRLMELYDPGGLGDDHRICQRGETVNVPTAPDARTLLDEVYHHYWELAERHKDSTGLTPIPRRAFELVKKVSLLLGIPGGQVEIEHVRWAWALIERDIDGKIKLAIEAREPDGGDALLAKILSKVTEDHGALQGRLRNICRKWPKDVVDGALARLVALGRLRYEETERGAKKYFLAK